MNTSSRLSSSLFSSRSSDFLSALSGVVLESDLSSDCAWSGSVLSFGKLSLPRVLSSSIIFSLNFDFSSSFFASVQDSLFFARSFVLSDFSVSSFSTSDDWVFFSSFEASFLELEFASDFSFSVSFSSLISLSSLGQGALLLSSEMSGIFLANVFSSFE